MENYRSILVPYDFREMADVALSQSYNLARLTKLEIVLLYVHEDGGFFSKLFSEDQSEELINKMTEELNAFAEQKSKETGLKITPMVARGKIHSKIVEVAEMVGAKFIVMGQASTINFDEPNIGANASRVIRNAKCPVITIASKHHYNGCRSILVPIDLTLESRQKVGWAIEMAKLFGSTIKVVSVLWSVNHKEIVAELTAKINQVKKFIEERNVVCTTKIIEVNKESEEVPAILAYAKEQGDIDLIMIMTQQETGLVPFFVSSQSTEIIRLSDIPVMSIVPKDMGEILAR